MSSASVMGRALVVGASGQVGHQIVSILGSGNVVPTSRHARAGDWLELHLDTLERAEAEDLVAGLAVDAIYCVGGAADVEYCEGDPTLAMRANCDGPAALAAASAVHEVPFVYFSTEYVFDGQAGPYAEDAPPNPINAYGRSKWKGERAVGLAYPNALILRTTVVYGPDPRARNFLYTLERTLRAGRALRVPSDQLSTPTYNADLAAAAVGLVAAGAVGVFHVCGAERLSRFDFALRAAVAMGLDASNIAAAPTAELGQRAPRPLQAGLRSVKLSQMFPSLRMRGVEESIRHWRSAGKP